MSDIDAKIDEWLSAGLITEQTAVALRQHENARPQSDDDPRSSTTLALIGEVVGYLGAVLAVSAVGFMLQETWQSLEVSGRLPIVASLTLIVAAAGVMAARVPRPPAQRLASVLFLGAVALSGWLSWVVADEVMNLSDSSVVVTGTIALVASVIYVLRRRALAQLATLGALMALIAAVADALPAHVNFAWVSGAWALLGAGWVVLSMGSWLVPARVGLVAGGLLTILGLEIAADPGDRGWVLGVALAASIVMLAASVMRRGEAALIVPGAVGLMITVPRLIDFLFSDTIATWVAVLVTGVALVVLAVWMVRERTAKPTATTSREGSESTP